jgi:molybdenum cofactor biosynthesis protein A
MSPCDLGHDPRPDASIPLILEGSGAALSPLFPVQPSSQQPCMLHLRDGLKDGFGRTVSYLRVAVTEQSNLGCFHGGPGAGAPDPKRLPIMSRNEVVRLVKVFTSLGIRKVRLVGGEPLLRRDLETIVAGIYPEVEGRVHLTTNGLQLARRARSLRDAGLQGVNISLDAADRGTFERLTGKNGFGRVLAGLEAARAVGLKVKLNAVILRGWNDDQIVPLARIAQRESLQVRFIEFTPNQGNGLGHEHFMPAADILSLVQEGLGIELEGEPGLGLEEGPARLFRMPGGSGKVGVVATLSSDFCDGCNRVRLTSRGELMACRFGDQAIDLLGPLRNRTSHDDLVHLIREALAAKPDSHPMRRGDSPQPIQGIWQVGS